ncbi:MAG: cation transporter [Actinobacteria bacterium]|nr:cation transporter [Actinomycetota bacterium]
MQEGSKRAILAAFVANLGIAIAKFIGFLITASAGLLAEAFHSVADTGNQGLLLLGSARGKKKPTKIHPFGYGRERYFWAFVVAMVLFTLGGLFAIYEGINKFRHPHETEYLAVAIGVLGVAVVLESLSLRTAIRESRRLAGQTPLWRFIRDSRQPELPVVLLEDIGAEIGLVVALLGVTLTAITDNPRWDALASIVIGLVLVVIALFLARETKSLLIGESITKSNEDDIVLAIEQNPSVRRIIHLRTQHLAPEQVLVTVKIEFDNALNMHELALAIDSVEVDIRALLPTADKIFIEPDIYRNGDQPKER